MPASARVTLDHHEVDLPGQEAEAAEAGHVVLQGGAVGLRGRQVAPDLGAELLGAEELDGDGVVELEPAASSTKAARSATPGSHSVRSSAGTVSSVVAPPSAPPSPSPSGRV